MSLSIIKNENLFEKYKRIRKHTEQLCLTLETDDFNAQPALFVSPPKWHLAHTTWFFEEFILVKYAGRNFLNRNYPYLFNSYYELVGNRISRDSRGSLTRPVLSEVMKYREYVDNEMLEFLATSDIRNELKKTIELGLNHEQQHQELLLTDIKYILGHNPLQPAFHNSKTIPVESKIDSKLTVDAGVYTVGYDGSDFCFDNEQGVHRIFLHDVSMEKKTVTNKEYLEFVFNEGYKRADLWLADGWDWVQKHNIEMPLYWRKVTQDKYERYSLNGLQVLNPEEPVSHVSFYEADAYARWKGKRLPTEFEWEVACRLNYNEETSQNFSDHNHYEPVAHEGEHHLMGNLWEWTNSAYLPYPFYKKPEGAIGEYNGKFMVNQMVLRGGSCATPKDHIRPTYRNFFYPGERWQFSGIRLAEHI